MSLPEPSFIDRDPAARTAALIAKYEALTGKTLQPAQVERIIIDLIVYADNLLRIGIQEAAKQNLVNYAGYPMLDYLGELVGCTRLDAQSSRTTIRFTLVAVQTFDVLIPKGTRVESKDGKYIFSTEEAATISAGSTTADVSAASESTGATANGYLAGEINNLVDPVAYVSTALNTTTSSGGAAIEDDDRYRERIKLAPESFTNAGSEGAYRYWAMSAHQSIIDVAVVSPSACNVNVYPLLSSGNPDSTMRTLVLSTLTPRKVRPLTDNVQVLAPTKNDFTIAMDITYYDWADTDTAEEAIRTALNTYADKLKAGLGKSVVVEQIIVAAGSVYGVYKAEPVSPAADIELNRNEWANCTGITINDVGVHA